MEDNIKDSVLVFADIETNSLQGDKLLQISCVTDDKSFNVFVNPKAEIPLACTTLTGFYFHKNSLYRNGRLLQSVSIRKALRDLRNWIISFEKQVLLVFHNGHAFDARVLLKQFVTFGIKFPENVIYVCDSLPSFRKEIKVGEITDHRLATLAKFTGVEINSLHDALSDSIGLKQICENFTKSRKIKLLDFLTQYKKPIEHFYKIEKEKFEKAKQNGSPK